MSGFTDPETLRERGDVEFVDPPMEDHQHHFEGYGSVAEMAIVGVTDNEGRLLVLERDQYDVPALPYTPVGLGNGWVAAAREAIATKTGLEATIDGPVLVRHHTYRAESGEETTGHDAVFAATPEDTGIDPEAGHDWTAVWRDTTALDPPDSGDNDVVNDIRLFVE